MNPINELINQFFVQKSKIISIDVISFVKIP